MPITVADLLALPGLGLTVVAGKEGLDRPIRLAHVSELQDPTPWLSGGELLLTTGMGLKGSPSLQRAYIRRLVKAELSGIGFGVGFDFDEVPAPIVRAAERDGFPVLEVPYPVPFIAISEAISSRLAEDRIADAQMSVAVHERLASLVSEGGGLADVLDEVIALTQGWSVLFDLRGDVLARAPANAATDAAALWERLPPGLLERRGPETTSDVGPHGTTVAFAVTAGRRHEAILVFGRPGKLDQRDRIVVHHAVTVLGLLLASRRAVAETERRIAGDILSEAFAGRLTGSDLDRRLQLVGFERGAPVTVLVLEELEPVGDEVFDDVVWHWDGALGRRCTNARTAVVAGRAAAVVAYDDPEALAGATLTELGSTMDYGAEGKALRMGVGETLAARDVRQSYLTALFALRATGTERRIAVPRDLGSYSFLLGAQPRPVLEGFVRSVLGPLIDRDHARSSELVASVRAFIDAGGRWETGAQALAVHRHTLRYRVRQAEELLGRDLSAPEDRLEVWLALKAAEILDV